jgi:outer membrane protein assembly factor BamB
VLNNKGIFARYNPETGARTYQSRVGPDASTFTASPWAYNGHVFVMSEEGNTYVIEAADEYRLVGVNPLDDFSMATPAIVGDRLLIRTQRRLYSIRHPR